MPNFCRSAALFVIAALFFVCGTWSVPLIDRDEPRFAEASREMLHGGNFIVPYFNNKYRFDKPPLIYWAQVCSYRLFGENDFAARFPSVIAGALTALVTYGFATRLYGHGMGLGAALIFMTSLQTVLHAKGAVADMTMVLFFTITMWAGWELIENRKAENAGGFWWLVFYGALALGFLAKGPVAWLPLAAIGLFSAVRKPGGIAKRFRFGLGMLLVLALVGVWGIPALILTHGEFFRVGIGKHVIGRSMMPLQGHGASGWMSYLGLLPFYLVTLFASFFPWSLQLPWLVKRLRRSTQPGAVVPLPDDEIFALSGIFVVFAVFSIMETKLPHYTLPAFPLLAILLARHLSLAAEEGQRRLTIGRWAGAVVVVCSAIALFVFPLLVPFSVGHELIAKSSAALTPGMEFASAEFREPSLVWYARSYVNGWHLPMKLADMPAFMAKPGPRFCVAPKGGIKPASGWKVFEVDGYNFAHFHPQKMELELIVKPD